MFKHCRTPTTSDDSCRQAGERRTSYRYPLVAAAEVIELSSGLRLPGRMSDLSMQGCYVETSNPFPAGTLVHLRLVKRKQGFETAARVCYSLGKLGMGLVFTNLTYDEFVILEEWLVELAGVNDAKRAKAR
jgi:hypothetical protein